jgi:hypothetical protein
MSGEGASRDLSGRWSGFYNYSAHAPPTPFETELRDNGGLLSGIVTEPGDTVDSRGMTLNAIIEGERVGSSVRFLKRYDYLPRAYYVVDYRGTLAPDGDEIEGEWAIAGDGSGTFLMIRDAGAEETAGQEASEEV